MVYLESEIVIKLDYHCLLLSLSSSASPPPPPLSLPSFESPLLSLHLLGWMMYYLSVRPSVRPGWPGGVFSLQTRATVSQISRWDQTVLPKNVAPSEQLLQLTDFLEAGRLLRP